MGLCPQGAKTTIEWQYPGEALQRIEGADDYSIKERQNTCPGIPYKLHYATAVISNGTLSGWNLNSIPIPLPVTSDAPFFNVRLIAGNIGMFTWDGINPMFHWGFLTKGAPPDGSRTRLYRIVLDSANYQNQLVFTSSSSGVLFAGFSPNGSYPPCPSDQVFSITNKNGQLVYSRAESVSPVVNYYCGDKCPPGTCQCDCGSMVCCYDTATGKAIKSFPK